MALTNIILPTVIRAAEILGQDGVSKEQEESLLNALDADPLVGVRLLSWIPEVFGLFMLAGHIGGVPETFAVRDEKEKWCELPMAVEPLVVTIEEASRQLVREGREELLKKVALRSATIVGIYELLKSGSRLQDLYLTSPAFTRLPRSLYPKPQRTWLRRLFCYRK